LKPPEEIYVANHKSAEKRTSQEQKRRLRNRAIRSKMKTAIRGLDEAVAAGSVDEAKNALKVAVPIIAKTASKGVIHKRTAARKISRLSKRVKTLELSS
jgi:small subunit ribosomal protein S20